MFGNRRGVVELPADGPVTMGGGDLAYGGFWARFAALIIDNAILIVVAAGLLILGSLVDEGIAAFALVVFTIASLLYWPIMECSARQATFGKQLLGLQVTNIAGERLSFLRSLGRNLAKIISAIPLYIGFLLAAFTSRKQALHDIIASCVIVRSGPSNFMKAVAATVGALLITAAGAYYYISNVYLPELEKAMKAAQKGKPAVKPMEQAKAPAPAFPPADKPSVGAQPTAPAIESPPTKVAAAPAGTAAPVAPAAVTEPAAPAKPAAAPAPAPTKPATAEIKPTPAQPAAAAKPATAEIKPPPAKPAPAPVAAAPAKPASSEPAKPATAPAVKVKPAKPEPVITAAAPADEAPQAPRQEPAPRPAPPPVEVERVPVIAAGPTPAYNDVMTAVMYRDRAGVTQLLNLGWWPDRRDSNGVTPLMAAAMNGDVAMTELLLSRGANPTLRGPGGSTLDYAGRGGDGRVADLLRKAGAR